MAKKVPLPFYRQSTESLAKALLGKRLVRIWRGKRLSGIIVETEAYLGARDSACHTWKNRRTDRVHSMYLPGGYAYVYLVYGMHHCFNVVAREADEPEAVLIRALCPDPGVNGRTDGPGRLSKALHIDRSLDGEPLKEIIFIEETGLSPSPEELGCGPRIGVNYAQEGGAVDWPLRFFWQGESEFARHVSRK